MRFHERQKSAVERKAEGHLAEIDIFGKPNMRRIIPNSHLEKRRKELISQRNRELKRLETEEGYTEERLEHTPALSPAESLELALIINPEENQISPEKEIAKHIRSEIVKEEFLENPKNVRFFTSVATPLDYYKVDAFFVINGIPITLDASLDPAKPETLKADIYVPADYPLKQDDMEAYIKWIEERAEEILKKYEEKLSNLKQRKLPEFEIDNIKTIAKVLNLKAISDLEEVRKFAL